MNFHTSKSIFSGLQSSEKMIGTNPNQLGKTKPAKKRVMVKNREERVDAIKRWYFNKVACNRQDPTLQDLLYRESSLCLSNTQNGQLPARNTEEFLLYSQQ